MSPKAPQASNAGMSQASMLQLDYLSDEILHSPTEEDDESIEEAGPRESDMVSDEEMPDLVDIVQHAQLQQLSTGPAAQEPGPYAQFLDKNIREMALGGRFLDAVIVLADAHAPESPETRREHAREHVLNVLAASQNGERGDVIPSSRGEE